MWREVHRRRRAQQPAERRAEPRRVVGRLGAAQRLAPQLGGSGAARYSSRLARRGARPASHRAAEARVGQHPLQQLLRRLGGRQLVELLDLLARQHQPRLELEQRGDQDEELGRGLEVELVARLQVVEVGDDHLGQLDLEQVELLAEDQRRAAGRTGPAKTSRSSSRRWTAVPDTPAARLGAGAAGRGAPDAHRLAHVGERLRGHLPRLLGAGGERVLERGLVGRSSA